ncbi:MAG: hypothetical protein QOE54_4660 [Streptosporangiaceae bacterium]|jgi:hypothetical protein|nr:hypothetical protein [Streptosporangiaceae bacterium]MDX6432294.1 hypothetical protein [Streptosporangiaceae bacterium]
MYAWIWRSLPGRPATKALVAVGLVLVLTAVLWYVVFPWAEPKLQFDHGTVEGGTSSPAKP